MIKNHTIVLILISLIIFIFSRFVFLGFDHTNNDSIRWFVRSENFLQGLKDLNFSQTYQKYHPGVTLMWLIALPRQIFYFYEYNFLETKTNIFSPENFTFTNFYTKSFINIILLFLVVLQLVLINKIWNTRVVFLYVLFLSLEPYFVGINRWVHLTSLEVMLGFTSFLFLILWKDNLLKGVFTKKYIIFSAIFLGLSVLTKITSIITGVVLLITILSSLRLENYKFVLKEILIFFSIFCLTVFVLFPALWTSPVYVLNDIKDSMFGAISGDLRETSLNSNLEVVYYPLILLFKISPIVLFVFGLTLVYQIKKHDSNMKLINIFLIVNLIFLTLSDQKIDRYSLIFFPGIFLLISIFISKLSSSKIYLILFFHFLFIIYAYWTYFPNLAAYYTPVLGGTRTALSLGIYENGGEYFYNAAQYLNHIDKESTVFVPNNLEAFSFFYLGNSKREFVHETKYVVNSLDIDRITFNNYGCVEKVAEFGPKDYPVVAIFKCN